MVFLPSNYKAVSAPQPKSKIFVFKRDGRKEPVMFDKITSRIQKLCYGFDLEAIDPALVALKVINNLYCGVTTVELDNMAAEHAICLSHEHKDYGMLAARIEVSNLHKETKKTFSEVIEDLYKAGIETGDKHPKIDETFYQVVKNNEDILNSAIIYDRDFSYSFAAMKILQKDFLLKINGKVVERPQHMHMRIAVAIHRENMNAVIETYNLLSEKFYMHCPITMSMAGLAKGQLLSDYSLTIRGDSIEGIYDSVKDCAFIARSGGTVGLNVTRIRCTGSYIAGTNGTSNGLTPMLRVFNSSACYTNQGGKNNAAPITIYLEPWHADVFEFLNLKRKTGKEEQRASDLNYALSIPDIFMRRVEEDCDWCLMCPHDSENLHELWGKEFEDLYTKFEKDGRFVRKVSARKLWFAVIESQIQTGGPAILFKDNCNKRSNHKNFKSILSSSHHGELMTYPSDEEIPGCGRAIINLDMFVQSDRSFDYLKLKETVKVAVRALDKMIDVNHYPLEAAKLGTERQRPLSIGVQGLTDTFILMGYSFDSEDAKTLNKKIYEAIYCAALEASCTLAQEYGTYETYDKSQIKQGFLHFDLWNVTPTLLNEFDALREKIKEFGVRNSLLVSSFSSEIAARIHDCSPGTQMLQSNLENVRNLDGNIKIVNKHLMSTLSEKGLWNDEIFSSLNKNDGSLKDINGIPDEVKSIHKTVWEIPQKVILEMAIARGPFIDHSQTIDVALPNVNFGKLTSMHFFAWKEVKIIIYIYI
ncbi:Ribonucleoside-diphosphate reductase large subunit [Armadillidium vulgare]|nr:Ribonucleoside-diphosphate reductase large subunit [Armadillidium vulgare]